MHVRDIVILCCFFIIFVGFGLILRQEYFDRPYPPGEKSKRLRLIAYAMVTVAWAVMAVAQWGKILKHFR
jgi:hypothetical protein